MFLYLLFFTFQLTPPNGQPPGSLYEGLHSDVWVGGIGNSRKSTSEFSQVRDIREIIGSHWVNGSSLDIYIYYRAYGF